MNLPVVDNDVARIGEARPDSSLIIESVRQTRMKPRGVTRAVLVDAETRRYHDRLWAQRDREEAIARVEAGPKCGFFRRLFGG